MTRRRAARILLIAAPFLLLALGTWALVSSPWPEILGLMAKGRHVFVVQTWKTVGLGVVAAAAYLGALALSYTIRSERP